MSVPAELQEERIKLQRMARGTWRWWASRGLGSLLVLTIQRLDGGVPWGFATGCGLWVGAMALFWCSALFAEYEQARIVKKLPKGFWGGWTGLFSGLGMFLALQVGKTGSRFFHAGSIALPFLVFAILIVVVEHTDAARRQSFDLLDAKEQSLRARLAPHFIFNTLNTLHAQIEQDPQGAQATTERLAELFRQVVEASDRLTIPLKQELGFVEAYLGIEQARLGDRLSVVIEVPEDLETLEVPPLSLQVLVENAVKHGVAPLERGGEVRVGAERRQGSLWLWVEDPGTGLSASRGTGTALETLRQRLEYPEDLRLGMLNGRHRAEFRWGIA